MDSISVKYLEECRSRLKENANEYIQRMTFQNDSDKSYSSDINIEDFLTGPGKSLKDFLYPDSKESFQNNVWSNQYNYIKVGPRRSMINIENSRTPSVLSSQSSSIGVNEKYWTLDLTEIDAKSESNVAIEEINSDISAKSSEENRGNAKIDDDVKSGDKSDENPTQSESNIEKIKKFSKEILEDPVIEENFQMLLNVTYSNIAELGYGDFDSYMENHKELHIYDSDRSDSELLLGDINKDCIMQGVKFTNTNLSKETEVLKITQLSESSDEHSDGVATAIRKDDAKISTKPVRNIASAKSEKQNTGSNISTETKNKMRTIHLKISALIKNIMFQLDSPLLEEDGSMEALRRQKRDSEFSSRFSRTYSYELTRQIQDLPQLMAMKNNFTNAQDVCQRIISLYQIVVQGLQAYLKHLPDTLSIDVPGCVCGLLNRTNELTDISLTYMSSPSGTDLKKNISSLIKHRPRKIAKLKHGQKSKSAMSKKKDVKDHWQMYKPPQKKSARKTSSKASKKVNIKPVESKEKCSIAQDSDVETAISKMTPEVKVADQVRSSPNLANPIDPKECEKLFLAIKYKKKLLKLMRQNPLATLEDRVWEMICRVVAQLLNEFLLDITSNTSAQHCEEESEF